MEKPKYNVLKNGAKSLFTIAKNAALGIDQSVPEEVAKERLDICMQCPNRVKATGTCDICKCYLKYKTKVKQEKCPIDKWLPYDPDNSL